MPPESGVPQVPRFAPTRGLPPRPYLPGLPHPRSDPERAEDRPQGPPPPFEANRWRTNVDYLHGIDLFNHAYYWEAHEVWETLWRATERGRAEWLLLKGLIQLASALWKFRTGSPVGGVRLTHSAREHFLRVQAGVPEGSFAGLDPAALARIADETLLKPPARPILFPCAGSS